MEKVTFIGSQSISISYQFQRSLSRIPPVEKITEILSSFLKIFRLQYIIHECDPITLLNLMEDIIS